MPAYMMVGVKPEDPFFTLDLRDKTNVTYNGRKYTFESWPLEPSVGGPIGDPFWYYGIGVHEPRPDDWAFLLKDTSFRDEKPVWLYEGEGTPNIIYVDPEISRRKPEWGDVRLHVVPPASNTVVTEYFRILQNGWMVLPEHIRVVLALEELLKRA